ncbi:MAG: hypothetical protein E4H01_07255 [Lysobacterales bacterium]|nr:MAG: hypothetical protein E4H01_07255 [Xanthomonadales bacterium]
MNRSTVGVAASLFLAGALLTLPAVAQWRVAQETPPGAEHRIHVALIDNESGHHLRLFNDASQNVRGIFTIRDGFDTIDPGVCPTYRVDEREPMRVTFEKERCRILLKQVEFILEKTGEVDNRELQQIMDGSNIIFRYRLVGGNYRETKFTLRGSKYALTTAVEDLNLGFDE